MEEIEKVLTDAFEMGRGRYPEDFSTLKSGMVKKLEQYCKGRVVDELEELLYALTFGEDIDPITDPVVEKYVKGRISELKTEEEK